MATRSSRRPSIVLAVLAVLAVALAGAWWYRGAQGDRTRAALASAVGASLSIEGRLAGFPPAERGVTRGPTPAPELPPDARIAIAQLEKRAAADASPRARADLGVAYLVQGDVDRAIATLADAASEQPAAASWSDLSAAYLDKAERAPARRIEYLSRALEAAERSLRVAPTNDARFNRALARDRLAPFVGEAAPWAEYLAADDDVRWREAAQRHLADDRPAGPAGGEWEARRRDLPARLDALDRVFVAETVRLFPDASREFLDEVILAAWGRAVAGGDSVRARLSTQQAALIADAYRVATGDAMLRDAVARLGSGDPGLARAHVAYAEGMAHRDATNFPAATRSFDQAMAGFALARSPYREWTAVQQSTILFQARELDEADRRLELVERKARARHYSMLLARAQWLRGLVYSKQWRLTEALAAFRAATALFEAARDRELVVALHSQLADALRTLGEQHESWEYIGRTLEGLPLVRKPINRYLSLYNAALFAQSQGLLEAALVFQHAAVRQAESAGGPVLIEGMTQRALAHLRHGDTVSARRDLEAVEARLADVPAGAFRSYISAELDVVRAQLPQAADGTDVVDGLRRAIVFFDRAEPARVPALYLLLARTPQARQSPTLAEEALALGIARLESRHSRLSDEAYKISYFDEAWGLFQDMVTLQIVLRKDAAEAFAYAERSRARTLLAGARGSAGGRAYRLGDIQAALPPSVTLVYYVALSDRLLIWTISREQARLIERQVDADTLTRLVDRHRESMVSRTEHSATNDRLHETLIRPVVEAASDAATLVFVPDGRLAQLPFATLRDPATRRYLIEDRSLLVTPSATFFVEALAWFQSAGRRSALTSALLIGNPAARTVAPLPGAEAEAGAAAAYYPRHEILVGRAATKERFLALAPGYEVVHFGGHALVNPEYPLLSRLVLAPNDDGGEASLFAHEISQMRLPNTRLVVLAACSSAAGTVSRGEGVVSVARPFLGAGVPLVVASQWDVDDRATEQLFTAFHRRLSKTQDPVTALRDAQLELLRGPNAALASPASWGAFTAVGTTDR